MDSRTYIMAHSCPNCGEKDEKNAWMGARMSSSEWEHDFSCCSDECGLAFRTRWKKLIKTKKGRKELAQLWDRLSYESDARLVGEPYYGYNAEQTLKYRTF